MSYLSYHHGSYWFQLRVPALLVAKYGRVLRVHLRTQERSVAQHQAYQMAGQWLERFQAGRLDPGHLNHPPRQYSCRLFMMLNPGRQGREMARYGEAFRNRVVARLLPPESAEVSEVSREIGVSVQTLERWRARARLEAVITTAAMDESGKSACVVPGSAGSPVRPPLESRSLQLPERLPTTTRDAMKTPSS